MQKIVNTCDICRVILAPHGDPKHGHLAEPRNWWEGAVKRMFYHLCEECALKVENAFLEIELDRVKKCLELEAAREKKCEKS